MKFIRRGNPLNSDQQLRPILQQVAELERVLALVRQSLPTEVAACCLAASWSGNQLIVAVSSGAAAMRLRHCIPSVIRHLHETGVAVDGITPRISSALLPGWHPPKQLQLPDSACDAFSSLADEVSDPGLKDAVLNLLSHHAKRRP